MLPDIAVRGAYERLVGRGYGIDWQIAQQANKAFNDRNPAFINPRVRGDEWEAWIGGGSTSCQGYNEVGEDEFLALQINIYGSRWMDGVEHYFIVKRSRAEQGDLVFYEGESNFSLYANC
jgi:hypothetical protein